MYIYHISLFSHPFSGYVCFSCFVWEICYFPSITFLFSPLSFIWRLYLFAQQNQKSHNDLYLLWKRKLFRCLLWKRWRQQISCNKCYPRINRIGAKVKTKPKKKIKYCQNIFTAQQFQKTFCSLHSTIVNCLGNFRHLRTSVSRNTSIKRMDDWIFFIE